MISHSIQSEHLFINTWIDIPSGLKMTVIFRPEWILYRYLDAKGMSIRRVQ
jgi:hypothetical protein